MKKTYILVTIIGIIFAYYFGQLNSRKEDTYISPSSSSSQYTFEMKTRCAEYREEIESKMQTTLWSSYNIDDIFYSPAKNSCLYAVTAIQNNRDIPYVAYIIWDYLSDKMLFYRDTSLPKGQDIKSIYANAKNYLMGNESSKYSHEDWGTDISD